jgi:hypothetical protein
MAMITVNVVVTIGKLAESGNVTACRKFGQATTLFCQPTLLARKPKCKPLLCYTCALCITSICISSVETFHSAALLHVNTVLRPRSMRHLFNCGERATEVMLHRQR